MDVKQMNEREEEQQAAPDDPTPYLQRSAVPKGSLYIKPVVDAAQRLTLRRGHRAAAAAVACLAARANAVT